MTKTVTRKYNESFIPRGVYVGRNRRSVNTNPSLGHQDDADIWSYFCLFFLMDRLLIVIAPVLWYNPVHHQSINLSIRNDAQKNPEREKKTKNEKHGITVWKWHLPMHLHKKKIHPVYLRRHREKRWGVWSIVQQNRKSGYHRFQNIPMCGKWLKTPAWLAS